MEKLITIYNTEYAIPAVFSYSQKHETMPAVILCHGTGSQKNEVGNLFAEMSKRLLNIGIASIRLDYAGCGDSKACQTKLSFCGEVNDTKKFISIPKGSTGKKTVYAKWTAIKYTITYKLNGASNDGEFYMSGSSGACHDGIGVFKGWFDEYYQEALENGYAKIPMFWRENLLLSKKWFDDIRDTTPMMGLRMYEGPILAIAGDKDELVPYYHAKEIVENSKNENSKTVIVKNSNHTFNVLMPNESKANDVIEQTIQWINKVLMMNR